MVALGETLDMQVVAEGIELTTQMTSLRQLGCELGQGFLFARPMGIESISNYLDDARGGSSVLRLPPPAQDVAGRGAERCSIVMTRSTARAASPE